METLTKVDPIPLAQVIYTSLLKLCIKFPIMCLTLWKKFIYLALINIDLVPDVLSSLWSSQSLELCPEN